MISAYFFSQRNAASVSAATLEDSYTAFDSNDVDAAIAAADGMLSRNPKDVSALLAKASALAQKGSLGFREAEYGPQAIDVAQQALGINPKSGEAWRIIGYANEIMQAYAAAHDAYQNAITLEPSNALAVAGDAHAYDLQGDMDKAEAGYRKALAMNPNLTSAKMGLARVEVYRGDLKAALALYQSVSALSVGNVRERAGAAYSAGQLEEGLGNYEDAEAHFRLATRLDPNYALGWTGLATELFRQATTKASNLSGDARSSRANESLTDLQRAITLNPNQSMAHYQLATQMVVMGRLPDALLILKGLEKQIVQNDITLSASAKIAMLERVKSALDDVTAKIASVKP
jgi:tetratricopeptide (TPR) repeat protein